MSLPTVLHWSGGKDSAHALGRLLADARYDVRALLTTVHPSRMENTVHGLPVALLEAQAAAVGLPLEVVPLAGAGLEGYDEAMTRTGRRLHAAGVRAYAFGDLTASGVLDLKRRQFEPLGLEVVEPLWGMSSAECMAAFLETGIRALTCVLDAAVLDRVHLGVELTNDFVAALPPGCDPCGEFGEYHSFTWDAPFFSTPIDFALGEVERIERSIGTTAGRQEFSYWRLHLQPR